MLTDDLVYWINEREHMRELKDRGDPGPYSTDYVMATTRFTNVRREDDKVTRWLKTNWRDKYAGHENMLLAMTMARFLNYIPTLEAVGFPEKWDGLELEASLMDRVAEGHKIWSSAYTISTCGRAMPKITYVVDHVLEEVYANRHMLDKVHSLEAAFIALRRIDGLGSFLSAQILADLKHVPGHSLSQAPDFMTWSSHGPGSLKGLSYFFNVTITPATYQKAIAEVARLIKGRVPEVSMQDLQNCLCEFSKYMRLKRGEGHARNKYQSS